MSYEIIKLDLMKSKLLVAYNMLDKMIEDLPLNTIPPYAYYEAKEILLKMEVEYSIAETSYWKSQEAGNDN